ncbi:uncharacterized protein LOC127750217 [Frankliniella occidentalis]|uniref:Uncharacterized protein LOC127750217 n=1 Tax=Frankliniella occidentalis TaxID=133901 RepID=A0A9C6X116_FRAOC|nr:uncharacterized protein LOC127750217 [Frankliniella occidentalis]
MNLEQLSDDFLLTVLRELPLRDVLECRRVCRRLGALALHPRVWRHRIFGTADPLRFPALRVAPCAAGITIYLPKPKLFPLYGSTRCAVAALTLLVKAGGLPQAAAVIRHQQELGRLNQIYLTLISSNAGEDEFVLLWTAASVPGLKSLTVSWHNDREFDRCPMVFGPVFHSSLKYFYCWVGPGLELFFNFVLDGHASTLEVVDLVGGDLTTVTSPSTAPLLASLPKLRRLACPPLPDMEAVAACELLREILLYVTTPSLPFAPAAAVFLGNAKQLTKVNLKYHTDSSNTHANDLVRALVLSGPSRVESLTISTEDGYLEFPQLQPLPHALPLMPALRKLSVWAAPDELLLAITPATAPALRTLKVFPLGPRDQDSGCAHSCLHREPMQTVLSRNPALTLIAYCSYYCGPSLSCEWCEEGCHREVWRKEWEGGWDGSGWAVDEGDPCPLTDWIPIPRIRFCR